MDSNCENDEISEELQRLNAIIKGNQDNSN